MTTILMVKQVIKTIYSKYEIYIAPVLKFLFMLICLTIINKKLGYMSRLNNMAIVLIAALMCSFLPLNFLLIIAALFVLLHLYSLSLGCAIVAAAVFLIMFLLYFRFSPKDAIATLITPICFALRIPYLMPIAMGLLGTPASAVSVGCGVITYYMIRYVSLGATDISNMSGEAITSHIRYMVEGITGNKAMMVTVVAFAITITLVYVIRRLPVDYSWTIAIVAGVIVDIMAMLIGDLIFDTGVSIGGMILGSLVAALAGLLIQFLFFQVDYTRVEKVQFEDDEYYYYVKAVPKITVTSPQKKVKKINSRSRERR